MSRKNIYISGSILVLLILISLGVFVFNSDYIDINKKNEVVCEKLSHNLKNCKPYSCTGEINGSFVNISIEGYHGGYCSYQTTYPNETAKFCRIGNNFLQALKGNETPLYILNNFVSRVEFFDYCFSYNTNENKKVRKNKFKWNCANITKYFDTCGDYSCKFQFMELPQYDGRKYEIRLEKKEDKCYYLEEFSNNKITMCELDNEFQEEIRKFINEADSLDYNIFKRKQEECESITARQYYLQNNKTGTCQGVVKNLQDCNNYKCQKKLFGLYGNVTFSLQRLDNGSCKYIESLQTLPYNDEVPNMTCTLNGTQRQALAEYFKNKEGYKQPIFNNWVAEGTCVLGSENV